MFDFDHDGSTSHQESAAGFLIMATSAIIVGISAITTYGFFSTYFPGLVPVDIAGPMYSRMLSGLVGVIIFDLGVIVWLTAFLRNAETPEQRAIALVMTFFCFTISAISSAAHLYMSGIGAMAQDAATIATLRNVSMVAVVLGVVCNFGAWTLYGRYSYASKLRVREADRRDNLQKAENQQAKFLDSLVAQDVKKQLEAEAPQLAALQAQRLAAMFASRERAKYHDGAKQLPPAATPAPLQPKREYKRTDRPTAVGVAMETHPAPATLEQSQNGASAANFQNAQGNGQGQ